MTALHFTKGHGTENDFVLLFDEHGELELSPERVRYLCDRRAGIGADGVIRAVRARHLEAGAGFSPETWFMDYWNSDGSLSEMCGNGVRVFAAFLEHEAGERLDGGLTIGTRGGVHALVERRGVGIAEARGLRAAIHERGAHLLHAQLVHR